MKRLWIPQSIAIVMLLLAFNPKNPYGYYILLRWVCCVVFAYLTYLAFEQKKQNLVWVFGFIAIIYNPVIRIHLTRDIWSIINIITIIIAGASIKTFKIKSE